MNKKSFKHLKAEEKRHLQALRTLKARYHQLKQRRRIQQALQDMLPSDLLETYNDTLAQLRQQTEAAESRVNEILSLLKAEATIPSDSSSQISSDPSSDKQPDSTWPQKTIGRIPPAEPTP